ncbi:TolC family outer membrane protein [Donghicola mangrovi]|uniref:TolC family outer membrane protein n=1 Tax=Donghicola mangrovi TaxID=2729614 RepID=A0A850QBU3_9RHOB|nr:TolC family outer membrane protein [Donghicola mangrovi]NVO23905.1 TolC family outer membrane protein [Donghicola mangrovi]
MADFKKYLKSGVAALALAVAAAVPANADTLGDALVKAYKNSGLLEQNRALLRAADEDVAQAVAGLRPILAYSASVTANREYQSLGPLSARYDALNETTTANLTLSASLLLYDGGASRMGIDVAKEAVLATRQTLRAAEQTVLLNAVSTYMTVLATSQIVSLQKNNVNVLDEQLRASRERFDVGEITRTDVALSEAALATSNSDLVAAQGDLADARAAYITDIGEAAGSVSQPKSFPVAVNSVEEALRIAMRSHPSLIAAQHAVAQAELNVAIAQAARKPEVSLSASVGTTRYLQEDTTVSENNYLNDASVGVKVSGPIYYGGAISSGVRQAMASRDASRASLHTTKQSIEEAVRVAYSALTQARAARGAAEESIRANTVAYRGVSEEASLGARTTLDVLDAEQDLLDARASSITAAANEYIAAYALLSAMGLLNTEYLKLNVPTYDPEAYYNTVKNAPAVINTRGEKLDEVLRSIGKK